MSGIIGMITYFLGLIFILGCMLIAAIIVYPGIITISVFAGIIVGAWLVLSGRW